MFHTTSPKQESSRKSKAQRLHWGHPEGSGRSETQPPPFRWRVLIPAGNRRPARTSVHLHESGLPGTSVCLHESGPTGTSGAGGTRAPPWRGRCSPPLRSPWLRMLSLLPHKVARHKNLLVFLFGLRMFYSLETQLAIRPHIISHQSSTGKCQPSQSLACSPLPVDYQIQQIGPVTCTFG